MSEAEWDAWDKQIEDDLAAGRLDKLLNEVKDEHEKGLTLPICEGWRKYRQDHPSTRRSNKRL